MSGNFKHHCTRRPSRQLPTLEGPRLLGAGSGGDGGDGIEYKEGDAGIHAGALVFTATGDASANPIIAILAGAAGEEGDGNRFNGRVSIHGSQGARITSGPPNLPPAANQQINGIELHTGNFQEISIVRGTGGPATNQFALQTDMTVIDGGCNTVKVRSDTQIVLTVANGMSSIILTPAGVQIKGILTQIN